MPCCCPARFVHHCGASARWWRRPVRRFEPARIPDRAKDEPGKLASMLNALLEKITGLTVKNSQGLASISKSSTQLGQLAESSNALISNLNTQAEALLRSATEQPKYPIIPAPPLEKWQQAINSWLPACRKQPGLSGCQHKG